MTEEQLREQLKAVYSSTSWKLTAPLRYCSALFGPGRSFTASLRRILFALIRGFGKLPLVRKSGAQILKLLPGLRSRVRRVVLARDVNSLAPPATGKLKPEEQSTLSPAARMILAELQTAMREVRR
ncbi:MAG: hypothetical protein V4634_23050 [Pseudomonadota bacterium]